MPRSLRPWSAAILLAALAGCGSGASHSGPSSTAPRPVVRASLNVGSKPCAVTQAGGSVWVTDYGTNMLARLDPATNRVTGRYPTGNAPCGITYAGGALWVADVNDFTLRRVDPATGRTTR